jgi:protein Mpv17
MGILTTAGARLCVRRSFARARGQPTQHRAQSQKNPSPENTPSPSTQESTATKAASYITTPKWFAPFVQPLTAPFRAYGRVQSRRPYITQFTSSLIIYFLGDLSSQLVQRDTDASFTYDPSRGLRAITIGGISSIPSYRYFIFLSSHFNYFRTHVANLALKVIINQLTFAPLFNTYFFGMQSLLSLETPQPEAMLKRVYDTVPQSWLMSCRFWPFVTAFSFTFVPMQHRSIFAGGMAIFWQTYLGILNQRAVIKEKEARAMTAA